MSQGHEPFTWFGQIPALHGVESHIVTAAFVATAVAACGAVAAYKLKSIPDPVVPEGNVTFRNFFEIVAEKLYAFVASVMGEHDAKVYFPVVASLFLFIFTSNIIGLVPGFLPPTDNINTTLAAGLFVFVFYNYQGLKANGMGYLKHFLGPVWYLAPLMLVIEIVSHVFRPLSLALRLRGNIMGDHVVLHVFTDLVPYVLPVIFYGMGVFVSFIQAFVFCLLTMVYISLSTAHDH
jgi:F-type H+-transporting ATPase subunit a